MNDKFGAAKPMVVISEGEYAKLCAHDDKDKQPEDKIHEETTIEQSSNVPEEINEIIKTLPEQERDGAYQCLQYVAAVGGIQIHPKTFAVICDGFLLMGSHAADILHYIMSGCAKSASPIGFEEIMKKIAQSRMPCFMIPIKEHQDKIEKIRKIVG